MNITQEVQSLPKTFEITSNEDVEKINIVLRRVIEMIKHVESELNPQIKLAHESHKAAMATKKKLLEPLETVEYNINVALRNWQVKKEAEAKTLQDKINKQLAEAAEEQRKKVELEAKNATNEWDKEVAVDKLADIKTDSVELAVCKEAIAPKITGQYKKSNWKARVINPELVPDEYWIINESMLDKVAKMTKGEEKINGIEFFDDFTIVTKM